MRKVIVSINTTLDGFVAGKQNELDWHFKYWDEEMARLSALQLQSADTVLLGRITYQAMSRYWPSRAVELNLSREDLGFANMMNEHKKIVFSKTLADPHWSNTTIQKTVSKKYIDGLKCEAGKNLIVLGSASIVSLLMRIGVVDEFIMWIHPVALSEGRPLFTKLTQQQELTLLSAKTLRSGVVLARYLRSGQADTSVHEMSAVLSDRLFIPQTR